MRRLTASELAPKQPLPLEASQTYSRTLQNMYSERSGHYPLATPAWVSAAQAVLAGPRITAPDAQGLSCEDAPSSSAHSYGVGLAQCPDLPTKRPNPTPLSAFPFARSIRFC